MPTGLVMHASSCLQCSGWLKLLGSKCSWHVTAEMTVVQRQGRHVHHLVGAWLLLVPLNTLNHLA